GGAEGGAIFEDRLRATVDHVVTPAIAGGDVAERLSWGADAVCPPPEPVVVRPTPWLPGGAATIAAVPVPVGPALEEAIIEHLRIEETAVAIECSSVWWWAKVGERKSAANPSSSDARVARSWGDNGRWAIVGGSGR